MAVSAAAALLDELMGRNRNDGPNAQKKPVHWEDSEVTTTRCYVNTKSIFILNILTHYV